ncbi:MAG: serine acetyltransferase [Mycobacterium sp.]|jgi:serine O-acetyltransferase|nr:serine acetyltransferase [Mycobacterium sp.]
MPPTRREKLLQLCAQVWAWPLWLGVRAAKTVPTVKRDVERWTECVEVEAIAKLTPYQQFARFAGSLPEFRSLMHLRTSAAPLPLRMLLKRMYPGLHSLCLWTTDIGPGFFIQHGVAAMIGAESIGANCWINQQVSVGFTAKGRPIIGDNVRIGAGAKVVGPIKIGDGATIGLNAIVMKDVPPGTVMVAPLAQPLGDSARTETSTRQAD